MKSLTRLRDDNRGTIMVIAIFMSACLVGCIWYMFGLGEAMVYRQQLRAAADATAFGSAVIDAIGMNIVVMLNIAMAVALSILLALQIIFIIGIVLTLFALLLEIPSLGADTPISLGLLEFDTDMYEVISEVQEPIFATIAAINVAEGVEGMLVPWAARSYGADQAELYKSAHNGAWYQPFSLALIPTRVPILFNFAEGKLGDLFLKKFPTLKDLKKKTDISVNPAKADASVSRYGLPITDDKYSVLCEHAAHELVQEFEVLSPLGWIAQALHLGPILDGFGWVFGTLVGQFPGVFCSGVDPQMIISNTLGVDLGDAASVADAAKIFPFLKPLVAPIDSFRKLAKSGADRIKNAEKSAKGNQIWSLAPMKTFDLYKNGNLFGQVWATIEGDDSSTTGAITGVDVAAWGSGAETAVADAEKLDYAEAEFYYDCGSGSPSPIMGSFLNPDSSGNWDDCKFNAMWNMFWKARVVRWQAADFPLLKAVLLGVWSGSGIETVLQYFARQVPFVDGLGVLVKYGITDIVKSCFINAGQGKSGSIGLGRCPIPTFGSKGLGDIEFGGTAPDGTPVGQVYH